MLSFCKKNFFMFIILLLFLGGFFLIFLHNHDCEKKPGLQDEDPCCNCTRPLPRNTKKDFHKENRCFLCEIFKSFLSTEAPLPNVSFYCPSWECNLIFPPDIPRTIFFFSYLARAPPA